MLKRQVVIGLSFALLVSVFSVVGLAQPKVTISVGAWPRENEPERLATAKKFAKIMLEKYNVEVVGDEWQYAVDSFIPKATGGTLPTVYNTWFTEPQKIIDNGYAANITKQMKKYGLDKAINPQILSILSKNSKIYGIPDNGYVQGLACNVKLFKQAGLVDAGGVPKAPKTFEELAQTAKIIKDKTGAAGFIMETSNNCGGWHFMNIAWSFGTVFEKKIKGKWTATFNNPEGVAALQYLKDLKWKYKVLPDTALVDWAGGQQIFATNQGAMFFFGGSYHGGFQFAIDNYKIGKDDISMFSLPAGPKGRYALVGGNVWMFAPNATPAQIEAGIHWLDLNGLSPKVSEEFKLSEEANYKTDKDAGYVVGVDGLPVWVNPEKTKITEAIRQKYLNVNPGLFADYNNMKQVTLKPEEPVACQELYKALDKAVQTVLTDSNADVKAVLDKTAADFQKDVLDRQ